MDAFPEREPATAHVFRPSVTWFSVPQNLRHASVLSFAMVYRHRRSSRFHSRTSSEFPLCLAFFLAAFLLLTASSASGHHQNHARLPSLEPQGTWARAALMVASVKQRHMASTSSPQPSSSCPSSSSSWSWKPGHFALPMDHFGGRCSCTTGGPPSTIIVDIATWSDPRSWCSSHRAFGTVAATMERSGVVCRSLLVDSFPFSPAQVLLPSLSTLAPVSLTHFSRRTTAARSCVISWSLQCRSHTRLWRLKSPNRCAPAGAQVARLRICFVACGT